MLSLLLAASLLVLATVQAGDIEFRAVRNPNLERGDSGGPRLLPPVAAQKAKPLEEPAKAAEEPKKEAAKEEVVIQADKTAETTPAIDPIVLPAGFQQPPQAGLPTDRSRDYPIQLEPPPLERVFRLESEQSLRERLRQELRQRGEKADFPEDQPRDEPKSVLAMKPWSPRSTTFVPNVVPYLPLYFEDKNTERYGWDAGIFQPVVSAGKFYLDLAILPYNMGVQHPCSCEFSAGYDLPGDCVPYRLYLPPWSWKGAATQAGTVLGGIAVFP